MKYTLVSALIVATNIFVAHAQVNNSSDSLYVHFSNDTSSDINGKFNTTNEVSNKSVSVPLGTQQIETASAAVYDVGGWNGSLYRSNRSVVGAHQPIIKQDAAISQIDDGQIQATATTPATTPATATADIPSNSTYISSFEGAGGKIEPKNMGCMVGLAALLFL
ncbi:hypothetical protein SKDZ_08G1710 [Saccharomyces kudriavzevii ZP591]|uniref:YHR126C-like protein n=1 Tax=Saccharomyces cerevisiae x Saccharomyces kudriavzevii (strain VIN7) TaxID=1095631 RepID=H0GVW2_SACCK|nr:YHR126C-like protein [Saccharomyces cerevisiae x Saccharomyces kudriavzevii VIN7]CAI4063895.1 hypothetical protein SKDZ_08G1710 [Saccharomyces kudriavzevii ZP591]